MSKSALLDGFFEMPLDGSFNDAFAPIYIRIDDEGATVALEVMKQHVNPMKILHGAVYMGMFDIAFACAVGQALGKFTGTPTMTINIDYMGSSKEGEIIFCEGKCLKTTRTTGFTQGIIRNSEGDIKASSSGLFKLPADLEAAQSMS